MTVPTAPITIKKYHNRRLYNTETSEYITHDTLKTMITNGKACRILDATTSEDLTAGTLAAILSDMHAMAYTQLPVPMLELMIRTLQQEGMANLLQAWMTQWQSMGAPSSSSSPSAAWPQYQDFFQKSSQWLDQWSSWLERSAPPSG